MNRYPADPHHPADRGRGVRRLAAARRAEPSRDAVGLYRGRELVPRRAAVAGHCATISAVEGSAGRGRAGAVHHRSRDAVGAGRAGAGQRHRRADPDRLGRGQRPAGPVRSQCRGSVGAERARRDLARLEAVRRDDSAAVAGKDLDAARAALREANARVAAAQGHGQRPPRPGRRRAGPGGAGRRRAARSRHPGQPAVAGRALRRPRRGRVLPARRMGAGQPAGRQPDPRRQGQGALLRARGRGRALPARPQGALRLRRLRDAASPPTIRYVSPRPEFTPPVIYSRDSRDRLVFMVEAWPDKPARPEARPAGRRRAAAVSADLAIDVDGLNKSFGAHQRRRGRVDRRSSRATSPASSAPTARARRRRLRMLCGLLTARQRVTARCSASTSPAKPTRSSARPAT